METLQSGIFEYRPLGDGRAVITGCAGTDPELVIPGELDGHAVTALGEYAFGVERDYESFEDPTGRPWHQVTIPEPVTVLQTGAFCRCFQLEAVFLPASLRHIGISAFQQCVCLKGITLPVGLKTIGRAAFSDCTGLQEITIPEGVTSIGAYAFHFCTALKRVRIGPGVSRIENSAFDCQSPSLVLEVAPGSYALTYAVRNGIAYRVLR